MFQKIVDIAKKISLPNIYLNLVELTAKTDYAMAEVALLLEDDATIAPCFLRIVNSPIYRRYRKIETMSHAVSIMGIDQIHDIVLAASVGKVLDGLPTSFMGMKKFWERSLYCAVMTRQLALTRNQMESNRFLLLGLLHDIGHLFMYLSFPQESKQAVRYAKKWKRPLFQVEKELLGFDYATVGGYVMKTWNLPETLQAVTYFHPEPGKAKHFALEAGFVHLASLLAISELESGNFGRGIFPVDPAAWNLTGLTKEQCLHARRSAAELFASVDESIFSL